MGSLALKYSGPVSVRHEFENVLLKFFDFSPEGTPATLSVYEYSGRYTYRLEIGTRELEYQPSLRELADVLEDMEKALSAIYKKKKSVAVFLEPENCVVKINGSTYSTSTSLKLEPGVVLEYTVLNRGWSATRTAYISYAPIQRIRVAPNTRRIIVPSDGNYVLNGKKIVGMVEVPEGFYSLKILRNGKIVYDDVICVSGDLNLATLKIEKIVENRWMEVSSSGKMMVLVDGKMKEIPSDTIDVFEIRGELYLITESGVRTFDGRYRYRVPVVTVIPEEHVVFLSDGRVVNLEENWERELPNPIVSWARSDEGYYLLTTTGEMYLFTPSRRTFERLSVHNAVGLVSRGGEVLIYADAKLEDAGGGLLRSFEFPIVDAASDGEYVYLLLSTGTIEVFPEGRKILSGPGKLWNFGNEVVFVSRGGHFLFVLKNGRKKESKYFLEGVMGVCRVEKTLQIITPSRVYVLRMMEE